MRSGNRLGFVGSISWNRKSSSSKLSALRDNRPRRFGQAIADERIHYPEAILSGRERRRPNGAGDGV